MNIQEFEDLTGKSVNQEDYAKYEAAYMNASQNIDKNDFCNAVRKAKPETLNLIFDLSEQVGKTQLMCDQYKHDVEMLTNSLTESTEKQEKTYEELKASELQVLKLAQQKIALCTALINANLSHVAVDAVGHAYVIKIKLHMGIELNDADRDYLVSVLKDAE